MEWMSIALRFVHVGSDDLLVWLRDLLRSQPAVGLTLFRRDAGCAGFRAEGRRWNGEAASQPARRRTRASQRVHLHGPYAVREAATGSPLDAWKFQEEIS